MDLIHELDRECFPYDAPPAADWAEDTLWWLASAGEEPAGYFGLWFSGDTAHYARVGVLPDFRRGGLGLRMARMAVKEARRRGARRIQTYVVHDNIGSMRALISAGLRPYLSAGNCLCFDLALSSPHAKTIRPRALVRSQLRRVRAR
jgi:ribosomal protein S18 acetylase RimI-like enzyme